MIDLTGVNHHPTLSGIVDVICTRKRTKDRGFFNAVVAYFFGKMASSMRASVVTKDRGEVPVNIFALALAESGFGKGTAVNIIQNELLNGFKRRLTMDTMPTLSEKCIWKHATDRSIRDNTDVQVEFDKLSSIYRSLGTYLFTFKECTPAAIGQMRDKLLLTDCGAMNLQVDEIGMNLSKSIEALTEFLELYDRGLLDPKLTKNTNENTRVEQIDGPTPANLLLFGTPGKVFDGGSTEDLFYALLDTGYARRCIFGWGSVNPEGTELTPAEIYALSIQPQSTASMQQWANHFHSLADPSMYNWKMTLEDDVAIKLIEYQLACEKAALALKDTNEIRAAEITHRYDKVLKLAGAYAFVDKSNEVEMDHLMQAILLVEGSGEAFNKILTREPNYERLAKYIASAGQELTQPDLTTALPFYKGNPSHKAAMMGYAVAWGYKNNIIIKKTYGTNNIEFFSGETLKATNLDEIILSYSDNFAYNYERVEVPFADLHQLTQAEDMNWCNHGFRHDHRAEENVIPGFNMIVMDVDGGVSIDLVHELLKEFKFMTYTTKRHRMPYMDESGTEFPGPDRFRLMIPTNYVLKLDTAEYKEMIGDIIDWLPFKASADVDSSSTQRSKKWLSNPNGQYFINPTGELFNVLPFIPKTSQNETFKKEMKEVGSMDNLERWFAQRMVQGDRNNTLLKYALVLVDSGLELGVIDMLVHSLNQKIANPMDRDRVSNTIMVTVARRLQNLARAA